MLFGTKTRPISDFLPRILSHIDGIDTDMAASYAMDSVIQFLRDTKTLTEIICVPLEKCVTSYKLNTARRITEVISVRLIADGILIPPRRYSYRIDNGTLYIPSLPVCSNAVAEVEVATAPARDSEEVPDFIYEDWADAIASLTLSKLYLLTDNAWYDPQAANNHMALYQQAVRQARFSRVTKHKAFNMRLANQRRM